MVKVRWFSVILLVFVLLSMFPMVVSASLAAPYNLNQTSLTYNSITMSWTYGGSPEISGFEISRSVGDESHLISLSTVPVSQKTYTDSTAAPDTVYYYKVRAISNSSGSPDYSSYSNSFCVHTPMAPPSKPTSVTAAAKPDATVLVTWSTVPGATGYKIERSIYSNSGWSEFTDLATVDPSSAGYPDATVVTNWWYTYRIKTIDPNGTSDYTISSKVQAIIAPPSSPSPLSATISGSNQIHLYWTDSPNSSIIQIHRKKGLGAFDIIKSYERYAASNNYDDTVTPGTYTYKIRVENILGNATTNESTVTLETYSPVADGPIAPANLSASVNGTAVNLTWEDRSTNEETFEIWRKTEGAEYVSIASVGAGATTYSNTGLTAGTEYTYKVRAANATLGTFSVYSNEVTVKAGTTTTVQPAPQPKPVPTPSPTTSTTIRLYLNKTDYMLNNEIKRMDAAPISKSSRTLLPIKYIASALGATTEWYPTDKKAIITFKGKVIILWVGRNMAQVDGAVIPLDPDNSSVVPITVPPGRTMMPLRFITEQMGCKLDWNPISKEIQITYPKP